MIMKQTKTRAITQKTTTIVFARFFRLIIFFKYFSVSSILPSLLHPPQYQQCHTQISPPPTESWAPRMHFTFKSIAPGLQSNPLNILIHPLKIPTLISSESGMRKMNPKFQIQIRGEKREIG
jgi:hypothetical protein